MGDSEGKPGERAMQRRILEQSRVLRGARRQLYGLSLGFNQSEPLIGSLWPERHRQQPHLGFTSKKQLHQLQLDMRRLGHVRRIVKSLIGKWNIFEKSQIARISPQHVT